MASFADKAAKKWEQLKEKLGDDETQRQILDEIEKNLKVGRETIERVEKEITSPENRAKAAEQLKKAKAKLLQLKKEFMKKQEQAVSFTRQNPEKALAVAAAAGALAGALWSALSGNGKGKKAPSA